MPAIPAFLHPDPFRPDLAYFLACSAAARAMFGLSIAGANVFTLPRQKMSPVQIAGAKEVRLRCWQLRSNAFECSHPAFIAICLPGVLLALHLELLHRPYAHLMTTSLGIVAAILLGLIANRAIALRRLGDLRVTLSTAPVRLDEAFTLHVISASPAQYRYRVRARFSGFEHNLFHTGRYVQISVKRRDEVGFLAGELTVANGECRSAAKRKC